MNKKRMAGDSGSESRPQSAEGACLDAGSESPRHLFGHSGGKIGPKRQSDNHCAASLPVNLRDKGEAWGHRSAALKHEPTNQSAKHHPEIENVAQSSLAVAFSFPQQKPPVAAAPAQRSRRFERPIQPASRQGGDNLDRGLPTDIDQFAPNSPDHRSPSWERPQNTPESECKRR